MPLIKCNIAGHEKADALGRNAKHSQSVIYISRFDLSNRLRKKILFNADYVYAK